MNAKKINCTFIFHFLYKLLTFSSLFRTGLVMASFCYLQFFPAPYDVDGNAYCLVF